MKLGPDSLILTNIGVKNVSELYRDYESNGKLPMALTYSTSLKELQYRQIFKIVKHEDCELYVSKYYDTFMSKMSALVSTKDTQILRYDIVATKLEPIIGGSYNVYSYLRANWKRAEPDWQPIHELLNYGAIAPNLASGDLIVKFMERKVLVDDNAYEIFSGRVETKIKKKTGEPDLEPSLEVINVFASQSFQYNYNFICVK